EDQWRKAVIQFKRALEVRPSPEAHFVLGSLYYKLNRDALAIRHLRKAINMDHKYREAFYLLGLVYQRTGQTELAEDALRRAASKSLSRTKTRKTQGRATRNREPLFDRGKAGLSGLISGIDRRLATALRDDA